VGTPAPTTSFTLSNSGTIPLNIASIVAAPVSDYSSPGNTCGTTLAVNSACTIQVSFKPSAIGDRPGSLTINGNVQGGSLTSSLDGTGLTPPAISVNPGTLTFGTTATGSTSSPQTLTIQNTGGAPLQLGARTLAGAGAGDYTLPGDTCGSTVAAGATCQLPVAFAPMQTGTRTAQLQIASNASNVSNGTSTVNLTGTAVTPAMLSLAPSPLSFPNTATGNASAVQNIVLTNSGGATAQLGTPTVIGDYQITANGCGSVLVGGNNASCTIGIVFAPVGTGSRSGLLSVPSMSIANSPVTAPLSGNGVPPPNVTLSPNPVAFGNQQGTTLSLPVTVTNSAGSTAQLGPPVVTGNNFAFVSNACAATLPVGSSCTLVVSFTAPDVGSLHNGTLTLPVNKASVTTALSGRGSAPANLIFTPASLTFDTTVEMTTSTKLVSVMNSGANPATITSPFTFSGPFSLASSTCPASPQTLAAGTTCTLQIAFTPPGASTYSGTVTVSGSFSNSPAQIMLSGQGATPAAIKFYPVSLGFPGTAQGSASPEQIISYSNTGGVAAALNTPTVMPNYWISFNNCPSMLPAGNLCHVKILFHPIAVGQQNGTFSQSGSQINSPTTAALTGTGLPHGPITLDPSSLTFNSLVIGATSAPQTVTVTNTSAVPVSLGSLTPPAGYVQTGTSCSAMLAAGDTCTVSIAFRPTIAGPQPVLLEVPDDGSPSAAALTLDGVGITPRTPGTLSISPASLAFNTVATGSSVSKTATVTNGGENPVHLSGITASGDFAVTGGNCAPSGTIAASASCTVVVTFSPTAQNSRSGALTITGDGTPASAQAGLAGVGAAPANVTLSSGSLGFGQVVNGSTSQPQVVTAANSGGVPVTLSATITGTGYSIASNQCVAPLAPNATCTLQITFTPNVSGDSPGTLSLPGAYSGSPSVITLDGTGVRPGMLVLSPNPVSFGIVVTGSPATQPATLQNTGEVAVPIGAPYASPASYAVTSSCGSSVAPGATCTLQVSFTPGTSGMLSGLLTVPASAGGGSATAALAGTGVLPGALAVNQSSLSYPDTVTGGSSSTQVATFRNSGGVIVPLSAPQVSSTDFTITNNGCGVSLDPGVVCNVAVAFTPGNAGARGAILRLTGGGGVSAQVALSGRGLAPAHLAFSPASLSFAPQNDNTTSPPQVLTLKNTGDIATSLGPAVLTGEYCTAGNIPCDTTLPIGNACGTDLLAGATCQITVLLAPQDVGSLPGSLTISSTSGSLSTTAALSGTGLVLAISSAVPAFSQVLVGTPVTSPTFITVANLGKTTLPLQLSLTGDFSLGVSSCGPTLPANSSCSLQVTFTPTTNGLRTGTFTASDGVETHSVQLSGIGLFPATDTLSVTVLTFPNTQLGTRSASQAVLVTNSGDATLALIVPLTNGPFSTANGCGASLGGHLSCTMAVSFVPATVGPATGTLTINDTISFVQHTQVVTLSGQGTPPPQAYTAPSNIDFGPYALSIATPPQIVTVSNPGSSAISNLAPNILGSDFSIASNTCADSLNPGASCQIGLVFTPSVIGNRQGTLTVQGSGASFGEPLIVSLTGSGEDFQFNVSGPTTATITSGQTAPFQFNVTPNGASTGSLSVTCSGAPVNATCTVNPASLSLASGAGGSFKVSVATGVNATTASFAERRSWLGAAALAALCPLLLLRGERRRRFGLLLVALALLGSPIACGVSASGAKLAQNAIIAGQTPSGSYPITITVSFPGKQLTATVTVIVQ